MEMYLNDKHYCCIPTSYKKSTTELKQLNEKENCSSLALHNAVACIYLHTCVLAKRAPFWTLGS